MYTTKEAAEKLGLSQNQVRYLLAKGELEGEKSGRDWIVTNLNNYTRKRKPKIEGAGVKISPEQIELLKLLQNDWRLVNDRDFKQHDWDGVHHVSNIIEIESPMGVITIINPNRKAKTKEIDQARKKHYCIKVIKRRDLYKAISPDGWSERPFRNSTVYRLEYGGLISQDNFFREWNLTEKGQQVLKEILLHDTNENHRP